MTRIYFCSDLIDFDKETIIDRTVDSTTFLRSYSGGANSFFDIVNSSPEMRYNLNFQVKFEDVVPI